MRKSKRQKGEPLISLNFKFMDKIKYVIFDDIYPVILSPGISHDEINPRNVGEPTSAGFVNLVAIQKHGGELCILPEVYGESISLGIKNNGDEDNKIIERFINRDNY